MSVAWVYKDGRGYSYGHGHGHDEAFDAGWAPAMSLHMVYPWAWYHGGVSRHEGLVSVLLLSFDFLFTNELSLHHNLSIFIL